MITIYKYPLQPGLNIYSLPLGAKVLSAQEQNGSTWFWAVVDPDAPEMDRELYCVGTGHPIYDDLHLEFITTLIVEGWMVWHLFEVVGRVEK